MTSPQQAKSILLFASFFFLFFSASAVVAADPAEKQSHAPTRKEIAPNDLTTFTGKITAERYAAFLNEVGKSDPFHLYDPKMSEKDGLPLFLRIGSPGGYHYIVSQEQGKTLTPYLSAYSAARFCNWLENRKRNLGYDPLMTEEGSYTLNEEIFLFPLHDENALYSLTFSAGNRIDGALSSSTISFEVTTNRDADKANTISSPDSWAPLAASSTFYFLLFSGLFSYKPPSLERECLPETSRENSSSHFSPIEPPRGRRLRNPFYELRSDLRIKRKQEEHASPQEAPSLKIPNIKKTSFRFPQFPPYFKESIEEVTSGEFFLIDDQSALLANHLIEESIRRQEKKYLSFFRKRLDHIRLPADPNTLSLQKKQDHASEAFWINAQKNKLENPSKYSLEERKKRLEELRLHTDWIKSKQTTSNHPFHTVSWDAFSLSLENSSALSEHINFAPFPQGEEDLALGKKEAAADLLEKAHAMSKYRSLLEDKFTYISEFISTREKQKKHYNSELELADFLNQCDENESLLAHAIPFLSNLDGSLERKRQDFSTQNRTYFERFDTTRNFEDFLILKKYLFDAIELGSTFYPNASHCEPLKKTSSKPSCRNTPFETFYEMNQHLLTQLKKIYPNKTPPIRVFKNKSTGEREPADTPSQRLEQQFSELESWHEMFHKEAHILESFISLSHQISSWVNTQLSQ